MRLTVHHAVDNDLALTVCKSSLHVPSAFFFAAFSKLKDLPLARAASGNAIHVQCCGLDNAIDVHLIDLNELPELA